jgi:NTE family protein
MSIVSGEPAAATVRAVTDLAVTVLGTDVLASVADRFPQVYRNLGAVVAARLARTNRLAAGANVARLVVVEGPAADAAALAASIAWHARRATLLLVVGDEAPDAGDATVESIAAAALERRVAGARRSFSFVVVSGARAGTLAGESPRLVRLDGRAVDAVAREVAGLRVGVALGGGSIRGYAHLGVLATLERAGIPIDCLAGASAGAVVGGLYAAGNDTDACADLLDLIGGAMVRAGLPHHGILSTRALRRLMRERLPDTRIEDLPLPLGIVTADLETQQEVVLRSGNLGLAMLAATAIPGIYPALRVDGHTLVDGGVLNPVPASVAAQLGGDVVIAVRLGSIAPDSVTARAEEERGAVPSTLGAIRSAIDVMQSRIGVDAGDVPTVTITPEFAELPSGKLRNFTLGRRYVAAGEAAAEAALPRIASLLPWLRT